ncbi:MAG TPA: type II secretion system protein M [Leucothrix mucor]|nr:type II secretion system protein M [Leucothrix mucor]
MSNQIKSWFLMLSSREKTLVSIAAISVTMMLFWLIVLNPILSKHEKLSKLTEEKQIELRIMQRQSTLVKQLQQQANGSSTKKVTGNPQQLIEQALQTWRLKPTLQRMQSQGAKKISLSLKNAEADKVMRFIAELESKYGLNSTDMTITKSKTLGMINIRLTLEKT